MMKIVKELEAEMIVENNRVRGVEEQVSQLKEQIQSVQQESNRRQYHLLRRFDSFSVQIRQMTLALWQRQQQPTMRIVVISMKGEFISLDVASSDTIIIVKMKIEVTEKIPPDQQRLLYRGRQLEDSMTLADYNIGDEFQIHLVEREQQQPEMRIFFRTLTGETIATLDVNKRQTVHTLKMMIWAKKGIPPDQQRLMTGGRQLDDGKTLSDSGISDQHAIDIFFLVTGCSRYQL